MNIGNQNANVINNGNMFRAFSVGIYDDLEDFIEQLRDDMSEGFNPKNICVCIGEKTIQNIEAQKEMIRAK